MAKLTPEALEAMCALSMAEANYIPPCPWNPFPPDDVWGREVERRYRADQIKRRAALAKEDGHG